MLRCRRYLFTGAFCKRKLSNVAAFDPNVTSPKINSLVDQIAQLSLMEVSDLVKTLKVRLNIQDIAMPTMAAAATPVAAKEQEAEVEEVEKKEQTEFKVYLEKFDAASKAKVIKEVKNCVPGLNLVEAKKFVESVPKMLKEKATKDELEMLKKTFEAIGVTLKIE